MYDDPDFEPRTVLTAFASLLIGVAFGAFVTADYMSFDKQVVMNELVQTAFYKSCQQDLKFHECYMLWKDRH